MKDTVVGTVTCTWYVKYSAKKPADKDQAIASIARYLKVNYMALLLECEVPFKYTGPPHDLV